MGQFPAAALIYRKGLVSEGAVLADIRLKVRDLIHLQGTPLPQEAAFDELRLKDVPAGTIVEPGERIDPLIHFAGRTRVRFTTDSAGTTLTDLTSFVNRKKQSVASSTGELILDYGKGLLLINAPAAQGASGDLKAGGLIKLGALTIDSPQDLSHVIAVSLDGRPLTNSRRILLQVMTEEKNSGFTAIPQGGINLIQSIGTNPWLIRKPRGTVRFTRPGAANMRVMALDTNGHPVKECARSSSISLLPDTNYYLIEP
jgi:hypothetical protein